jgi:DNA polymerase V
MFLGVMRRAALASLEYLGPISEAELPLPFMGTRVCAGFPSPADDFLDGELDLQRLLVPNRPATFLWRVQGDSMIEAGIHDGDIVIVDRSRTPENGEVVVATISGEVSLKVFRNGMLHFANKTYPALEVSDYNDAHLWGVVIRSLHVPRA